MSVWRSNIHLNPSTLQTAVRALRPLLSSHFPLSLAFSARNLRNPGAQSARQHPTRQGETRTHAAFKTQTNLWHINPTNWSQMLALTTAAEKQVWNKTKELTLKCESGLRDDVCVIIKSCSGSQPTPLVLRPTLCYSTETPPCETAQFAASALLNPAGCGSVRGLAASALRWSTSESQES